jgi:hypothetical protein
MIRLRTPVVLVFLGSACTLLTPEEDYFSGSGGGGSSAASGGGGTGALSGSGSDPVAGSGAMTAAGGSAGEAGTTSGGKGGSSGATSGGRGGSSGGAGGASGATSGVAGAGAGGEAGATSGGEAGGGAGGADSGCPVSVENPCVPNAVEPGMQACGACNTGKQSGTRTCSPTTCTWGPWSWGECTGITAACTPGSTTACSPKDKCGQRVCSSSCSWGGCTPVLPDGCVSVREGHTDEGSNYRCCGTGKWEFCSAATCKWSGGCAACSQGAPSYCTECYP